MDIERNTVAHNINIAAVPKEIYANELTIINPARPNIYIPSIELLGPDEPALLLKMTNSNTHTNTTPIIKFILL